MDPQTSWWFKPQTVDLLEGVDWSNVRWILFPSLSLSEQPKTRPTVPQFPLLQAVSWYVILRGIAEKLPWKRGRSQPDKVSVSFTFISSGWLPLNSFFMWGKRLEVTFVSEEREAEPESCPSLTLLIQRQSQGGGRLSRVSEQSQAVVCTCCDSCSGQKKSYTFVACSSSGVRVLPSFIFSGFYSTLQAQTVTRSVNLKLVMTVDAGKTHASGNIFFFPLLFPCLKFLFDTGPAAHSVMPSWE